jgi:hypothetical protein
MTSGNFDKPAYIESTTFGTIERFHKLDVRGKIAILPELGDLSQELGGIEAIDKSELIGLLSKDLLSKETPKQLRGLIITFFARLAINDVGPDLLRRGGGIKALSEIAQRNDEDDLVRFLANKALAEVETTEAFPPTLGAFLVKRVRRFFTRDREGPQ